jgi:prepilin-type processing-associated H-X9-DG protein/prepilin-type N-terminal cleavage/methylation domain-containing protein
VKRAAFTIVELLVVISILVLLASLLYPALRSARDAAFAVKCVGNLRSIGQAAQLYTADYDDYWPQGAYSADGDRRRWDTSWHDLLASCLGTGAVFYCPSAPTKGVTYRSCFGANRFISGWFLGANGSMVIYPEQTIFVTEKLSADWPAWAPREKGEPYWLPLDARHSGKVNILWCDGHVASRDPAALVMRVAWKG